MGKLELLLTKSGSTPDFHVKSNIQGVDGKLVRTWLADPEAKGAWEDSAGNNLLPNVSVSTNGSLKFRYQIGHCETSGATQNVREAKNSSKKIPQTEKYGANPIGPVPSRISFTDSGYGKYLSAMEGAASAMGSDSIEPIQLGMISSKLQGGPFQPVFFECSAESLDAKSNQKVNRVRKVYLSGQAKPLDGTLYLGMDAYGAGTQDLKNPDDGAGDDRIGWITVKSGNQLNPVSYFDASYMFVTNSPSTQHNNQYSPFPWHNWYIKRVVANGDFLKPGSLLNSMATHTAKWKIGAGEFNKDVAEKLNKYLDVMENGQKKVKAAKR